MIKCYFVDVKSISSDVPRSNFDESELERLADLMLATDGLLRPLILERIGVEKYRVIAGDREYYAAVIAKEKDIEKAEMVNAFVIESHIQAEAIAQLDLLTTSRATPDIEILLTSISAVVAQQLQPILTQLDRHDRILNQIDLKLTVPEPESAKPKTTRKKVTKSAVTEVKTPEKNLEESTLSDEVKSQEKQTIESNLTEANSSKKRSTKSKATKTKQPATERTTRLGESNSPTASSLTSGKTKTSKKQPTEPQVTKTKSVEIVSTTKNESSQSSLNFPANVDPLKADKTLELINLLDENTLMRQMKQSGIPKAEKLVPNIIAKRELQPRGKFDSWQQIAAAKISGLGSASIIKIIDKLK